MLADVDDVTPPFFLPLDRLLRAFSTLGEKCKFLAFKNPMRYKRQKDKWRLSWRVTTGIWYGPIPVGILLLLFVIAAWIYQY
jgi:hypothetical protein